MMTSAQIRQSFLDFFKSKGHSIVPSSSLMPDSPNLLFTNAGMNQFVPIFLGQKKADVSKWAGAVPGSDTRAADTQKCIRAGGKHNDLDDVGLDTYHHTFFEMLGNWSFGDYFKKEAIDWAWELVVEKWQFPPKRLYATVYCPHMDLARWQIELTSAVEIAKRGGHLETSDTSDAAKRIGKSDEESATRWAIHFLRAGIDPYVHIVPGNKKDNFWMMGETGPCGPCSEIHVDLTPEGNTQGSLVNKGDARCIEIWNLVFIQFNANPDGSLSPLPAKHVDTGMGFERVTSITQGTKGFKDFANAKISNYETDIFRPIFDVLEKLSGKKYGSTLPTVQNQSAPVKSSGEMTGGEIEVTGPPRHSGQVPDNDDDAAANSSASPEQIAMDIAFRVIADHIRTLSFAIADGIQPSNEGRGYVLRRILRRAVRYGRTLGFHEPFFYKLVDVLVQTMGDIFPEIRAKKKSVQDTIRIEEEAFNKTLDKGLEIFEEVVRLEVGLQQIAKEMKLPIATMLNDKDLLDFDKLYIANKWFEVPEATRKKTISAFGKRMLDCARQLDSRIRRLSGNLWEQIANPNEKILMLANGFLVAAEQFESVDYADDWDDNIGEEYIPNWQEIGQSLSKIESHENQVRGSAAFLLYDTYGFPLDLTELMARERGLTVDKEGFEKLMEEQKARGRAAQKKEVITLSQIETTTPTKFVGYDNLSVPAKVLEVVSLKDKTAVVLNTSPFYAEMGGQVGDTGQIEQGAQFWRVANTQKSGNTWLHFVEGGEAPATGQDVTLTVAKSRRDAIQRHHTVTHLLHWALHEVVSKDATQKGSFVGPDKLTFDFNSAPLTPQQVADIEKLVNERILENAGVSWTEVPYAKVKARKDLMQFFGDKYGDVVRVVQIGGQVQKLDGYSMELCGGTHTRATGEIGLFRIAGEGAIAAGVRRIEAVAGLEAYNRANDELHLIKTLAGKVNSPVHELEKKIESLLEHQKAVEKQLKAAQQREASNAASELLERAHTVNGIPAIIHNVGGVDGDFLQSVADSLKGRFKGVIVLGGAANGAVALVAAVSPEFTSKIQAGKIIQQIAPIVGGKGGGKPDNARGGGKDAAKLDEALAKAKSLLG
jgi:alanyl-tRNA synthetase